jgi:hypothetical protein
MANDIEKVSEGSLAKNKKLNEVIGRVNTLLNIEVSEVEEDEPLEIEYSDNNIVLRVPKSGGGVPEDFSEETLDVVNANNTAGQRVFLTKAV